MKERFERVTRSIRQLVAGLLERLGLRKRPRRQRLMLHSFTHRLDVRRRR